MNLLVERDSAAHALLIGSVVVAAGSELVATYAGQARDGRRSLAGSVAEALFLRKRADASASDRWTKQVLVAGVVGGLLAGYLIASRDPGTRMYADNWATLGLGVALICSGVAVLMGSLDARPLLSTRGNG